MDFDVLLQQNIDHRFKFNRGVGQRSDVQP
jgi:hypothetical protein